MRNIRLVALALMCLPAAVAGRQQAQQSQQSQQSQQAQQARPTFRAGADFIRVDAFVTRDDVPVHDLQREDFEVLEDGKAQKIETFEHVLIRPGGPQETRVDPGNVRDAREMAADPRARVFALFLDADHVTLDGSHNIRKPIINLLNRVLGQDDLIGWMTTYASARDLTLTRKTAALEKFLTDKWDWGQRDRLTSLDPIEDKYAACYGTGSDTATDMIGRRRERRTLEALHDLVIHLAGLREERKAILVVTDGWLLYRQDTRPATAGSNPPGAPPIFVGPGGKIGLGADPRNNVLGASKDECDRDRLMLALMDNEQYFRDLMDLANRANASFYPIDPRGLSVFDVSIGNPLARQGVIADSIRHRARGESFRTMAVATDGVAVIGSNDIDAGLRKLSDDLSSYYLLGYYSPAGTDGRYHGISVRVKRPGLSVRARRGYRAVKPDEVVTASVTPEAAAPNPVADALGALASVRQGVRLHLRAGAGASGSDNAISVTGEIDPSARAEWARGGTATIEVMPRDGGRRIAVQDAALAAGRLAFMSTIELPEGASAPAYTIRVRMRPHETGGMPLQDSIDVSIARAANGTILRQPVLFRRGLATGVEYVPAADPRFRRSDRIRLELALPPDAGAVAARLLDRNGKPLPVPIAVGSGGSGRVTGELTLAPLTQGDYVIEISYEAGGGTQRSLTPIRIIP